MHPVLGKRVKIGLAAALISASVLGLGAVGVRAATSSLRETLAASYRRVGQEDGGRTLLYAAALPPTQVADRIASRWRPADRVTDPAGVFLRYRRDFVAITPDGQGSRVAVSDERTGYRRYFPYIGGLWGLSSRPGEAFRGGGPGAGK